MDKCKLFDGYILSEVQTLTGPNEMWIAYSPMGNRLYCSGEFARFLGADEQVIDACEALPNEDDVCASDDDVRRYTALLAKLSDDRYESGEFRFVSLAADGPYALKVKWVRETALCQSLCPNSVRCAGCVIGLVTVEGPILGAVSAWGVVAEEGGGALSPVTSPVFKQQAALPNPCDRAVWIHAQEAAMHPEWRYYAKRRQGRKVAPPKVDTLASLERTLITRLPPSRIAVWAGVLLVILIFQVALIWRDARDPVGRATQKMEAIKDSPLYNWSR